MDLRGWFRATVQWAHDQQNGGGGDIFECGLNRLEQQYPADYLERDADLHAVLGRFRTRAGLGGLSAEPGMVAQALNLGESVKKRFRMGLRCNGHNSRRDDE